MRPIYAKDVKDIQSFQKYGNNYEKVYADDDRHIYIFKVFDENFTSYEVILGKRTKNPDGSIVYAYPGGNDWGTLGFSIRGCDGMEASMRVVKQLEERTKNKDASIS